MIKLYLKGIIVLLLFFCLFIESSYAQQTVTYSFQTPGILDGRVPFDRAFRIKFQHIDSQPHVTAIVVKIYLVGVTNYRKLIRESESFTGQKPRNGQKITLNNDDLLKYVPIIRDSLVEGRDFSGAEAQTMNLITLKPSSSYFIQILTYNNGELSDANNKLIYDKLCADDMITALVNEYAKKNIEKPDMPLDYSLTNLVKQVREYSSHVVKTINKDYTLVLSEADLRSQLHSYKDMYDNIANITNDLKELHGYAEADNKSLDKDLFMKKATDIAMQLDWSTITDTTVVMKALYQLIPSNTNLNVLRSYNAIAKDVKNAIIKRDEVDKSLVYHVIANSVISQSTSSNTFPEEFVKQASQFIASDVGLAYVWGIGRVSPYIAAQISLTPLDDSIPLREYKGLGNVLRSRISFLLGMSVDAVAKDSVRKGIVGGQALILGTGFKLWTWLKLNGGFYLYYREPVNPTLPRDKVTFTGSPFVSLSIDVRVQALLNGVGNAIFPHPTN